MAYDPFAPRAPGERRYWLVKTEPDTFSFDDLMAAPNRTTTWDGVRNPIARNYLRDGMKVGDRVFFYHTGDEKSIVGICEVVRDGYPDATALDKKHAHFDASSKAAAPTWFMVDVRGIGAVPHAVPLSEIKKRSELAYMPLVRIGRLSVSPVTPAEWQIICDMGGVPVTLTT